jgi:transposase
MIPFQLSDQERADLQESLAHGSLAKQYSRIQALLWLAAGEPVDRIAHLLDVSRRTVYYWAEHFRERAELELPDRLSDAPRSGRPCTAYGVIDPFIATVIDSDPRDLGYRATGWTNALLRHYLKEVHHVAVSRQSVQRALVRLDIRWKRPRHQLALRPDTWRQSKGGSNAACKGVCAPSC